MPTFRSPTNHCSSSLWSCSSLSSSQVSTFPKTFQHSIIHFSALHFRYIRLLPESNVLMLYGVVAALFVKFVLNINTGQLNSYFFFMILLPAIVNDAGLSMQKKYFFQALPKILLFAVIGTVLHAVMFACTLYWGENYFTFTPGFMHMLVYATLISAVDPVSVLSTFAELDVKRSLYILVFGESLLNDAVTIVLYRTSIDVIKKTDASGEELTILGVVITCCYQFFIICFAGILCGVITGLCGVLIMKYVLNCLSISQ